MYKESTNDKSEVICNEILAYINLYYGNSLTMFFFWLMFYQYLCNLIQQELTVHRIEVIDKKNRKKGGREGRVDIGDTMK